MIQYRINWPYWYLEKYYFDLFDLYFIIVHIAFFLSSFIFSPNSYINPSWGLCVLYWFVTLKGIESWSHYRTPVKPNTRESLAREREENKRLAQRLANEFIPWKIEYDLLLEIYWDVIDEYDILLRLLLAEGYSDSNKERPHPKWILSLSRRTEDDFTISSEMS